MLNALLLVLALDAPAPAASPKPKPKPVPVVVSSPEPFDAPVDVPGEKQPDTPASSPPPPVVVVVEKPTPVEKANARGFHYDSQIGALFTATAANDDTKVSPFFWINTDGPIPIGNGHSFGRLGSRFGLTTAPGKTLNALDVNTYNALEADFWGGYVIGALKGVETTLIVEGGFASRVRGATESEPQRRLSRSFGGGIRFDARKSSAYALAKIGFDEATTSCHTTSAMALPPDCYDFHSGVALMMRGQVPLYKDAVLFTGDVSLSLGGSVSWLDRRDILRFGVAMNPVETVKELKKSGGK